MGADRDAADDDSGGPGVLPSRREIYRAGIGARDRAAARPRARKSFGPGSRGRLRINNGLKVINGVLDVRINFTMQTEPNRRAEPPLGGAAARSFYRLIAVTFHEQS